MNQRFFALLMGLMAGAAVIVYFYYFTNKNKNTKWEGTVKIKAGDNPNVSIASQLFSIIRARLADTEHRMTISQNKYDEAEITIKNINDTQAAYALLTTPGKLQIRPSYFNKELHPLIKKALEIRKAETATTGFVSGQDSPTKDAEYLLEQLNKNNGSFRAGDTTLDPILRFFESTMDDYTILGWINLKDTQLLQTMLRHPDLTSIDPYPIFLFGTRHWQMVTDKPVKAIDVYAIRNTDEHSNTIIDNEDLAIVKKTYDYMGKVQIGLTFNRAGTRKWEKLTEENAGKPIAMIMDNSVFSAPVVEQKLTGPNSLISGSFSEDGADIVSSLLSEPPLPDTVKIISATWKKSHSWLSAKQWLFVLLAFVIVTSLVSLILTNFTSITNKQ